MSVDTVPNGFPAIPILATANGNQIYEFLQQAFDGELLDRGDAPNGQPAYMTLRLGDTILSVMMPREGGEPTRSAFYLYVPDVDSAHRRAVSAGAQSVQPPTPVIHGDRMATVIDPFGNQWTIATRLERISVEELHRRMAQA